jgi:hypothetical protein
MWKKNGYLETESKLYDKASKRLDFHVGTVKPYLEYLEENGLYHKRISILLQALTNSVEIRKIIIKNDRDIIQGINEILLLYYHSKQIINIIRNILKIDENLLLNVLTDSKNELAKAFIQLELQEEGFWEIEDEKNQWWDNFVRIHSIEPSYVSEFNDLIIKHLKKEKS